MNALGEQLLLVAGQGEVGGGEQMLLRIGEAAQHRGWRVRVLGPQWGELGDHCLSRGFDYVTCFGSDRKTFALSVASRLSRRIPGLVWANGALPALSASATPNDLVVHLHQRPSPVQRWAIRVAVGRARLLLVPSRSMQEALPGSRVLLNWTPAPPLLPRETRPGSFTIAYLGRLSTDKGVDTLAEAADKLARRGSDRGIRLVIAGDSRFVSDRSAQVVHEALHACAARVVNLGWYDPAQVFAQADVVVVPSRWEEPFGLVAAEAMAARCPLIVSNAGALPEVVGDDYSYTFPAGDAGELVQMLCTIADGELPDTDSLYRRWQKMFSPDAGQARVGEILREFSSSLP